MVTIPTWTYQGQFISHIDDMPVELAKSAFCVQEGATYPSPVPVAATFSGDHIYSLYPISVELVTAS